MTTVSIGTVPSDEDETAAEERAPPQAGFPGIDGGAPPFPGHRRIARDRSSGRFRSRGNGQRHGIGQRRRSAARRRQRLGGPNPFPGREGPVRHRRLVRPVLRRRPDGGHRAAGVVPAVDERAPVGRGGALLLPQHGSRLPAPSAAEKSMASGSSRARPGAIRTPSSRRIPGTPVWTWEARVRTGSTELVYDILRTPRSILDVGAGVRVKIPPDAFVRTRFQHARPVAVNTLGRFTATAYWDAQDGFGESNQVDLERWLAPPTLLRWSNSLEITEKSNGWTWGTDLSLLHKLSPKSAITFAGGVSGSTRPAWIAQNYRVLARYRRNVWRKWLFLEGEPDIHWPRKEDGSRKPVWGATLRVEILFTGAGPDPPADGGERALTGVNALPGARRDDGILPGGCSRSGPTRSPGETIGSARSGSFPRPASR